MSPVPHSRDRQRRGEGTFDPEGIASIEQALVIALRMFEDLK